jgi:glycosyltransferase involved in cell wall biosynthesis
MLRPDPSPTGTLYISYDGLLEPLGESQVVNYLVKLAASHRLTVLSFEKPSDLHQRQKLHDLDRRLRSAGIRWIRKTYHKRPVIWSTLWDCWVGLLAASWLCLRRQIRIVHARSYVPALIALLTRRVAGVKFIFDMRGFWADEKVDGGHWTRDSFIYSVTKWCERRFLEGADAVVCLTEEGAKAIPELGCSLPPTTSIRVIPTCADLDTFSPGPKDRVLMETLGLSGCSVLGCVGSMSNWYLREAMLQYLGFLLESMEGLKVLIVTREDHKTLYEDAIAAGIPKDRLVLTEAAFSTMPAHIRLMDLGIFFIRVCFSKRGSAATKLGEFLACGVPVVINDGIGDSGWIVRRHRVGVVLADTTLREFEGSVPSIRQILSDPGTKKRCRETAERYFDLEAGVRQYHGLYKELLTSKNSSARSATA